MENRHVSQLINELNGDGPGSEIHIMNSTGLVELFSITDAGVRLSVAGAAATSPFPMVGMIVAWHGALVDIPTGWALCDGTNGTPDLRDKFIVGAGSTYALNATGGAAVQDISHTHTSAPHTHLFTALHTHNHSHNHGSTGSNGSFSSTDRVGTGSTFDNNDTNHTHSTGNPNTNTSTAETPGTSDSTTPVPGGTAGSTTQSNLPPYYGLFFIKRIAA